MRNSTFLLIRHGETIWNTKKRFQGDLDSRLTDLGEMQAKTAGRFLAGSEHRPTHYYCSPLGRAKHTAKIIAEELKEDRSIFVQTDYRKEYHFGEWQSLSIEQIEQKFPGRLNERERDKWHFRVPGGETQAELEL